MMYGRYLLFMYGYKVFDIVVQDQYIVKFGAGDFLVSDDGLVVFVNCGQHKGNCRLNDANFFCIICNSP